MAKLVVLRVPVGPTRATISGKPAPSCLRLTRVAQQIRRNLQAALPRAHCPAVGRGYPRMAEAAHGATVPIQSREQSREWSQTALSRRST